MRTHWFLRRWTAGLLLLGAVAPALVIGCSSQTTDAGMTGVALVALSEVPSDVTCVAIAVQGSRAVTQRFDVVVGTQPVLKLSGLPLGAVQVSGEAFASPCATVSGASIATWISDAQSATIASGVIAQIALTMHRNGRASIDVTFSDEGGAAGGSGGAGPGGAADGGAGTTGGSGGAAGGAAGSPDAGQGGCRQAKAIQNLALLPVDINDRGQVMGELRGGARIDVCVWEAGTTRVLPLESGSVGVRINNAGQVAGTGPSPGYIPYFWDGQVVRHNEALSRGAIVADLNDAGDIVGYAYNDSGGYHAFLWRTQSDVVLDLGSLAGSAALSWATAVSATGQVVGVTDMTFAAGTTRHAFLWTPSLMRDLGALDGNVSVALAINAAGQIAGSSRTASNFEHAVMWENGHIRDLGTLGGYDSAATRINASGQIIGFSRNAANDVLAFLWEGGSMRNLGTLGGNYAQATDISDSGEVVGSSGFIINLITAQPFLWRMGVMANLGSYQLEGKVTAVNNAHQLVGWNNTGAAIQGFFYDFGTCPP